MKKVLSFILVLALALSFACAEETRTGLNVLLLVPSTTGSYFSAAVMGVKRLETTYPGTTTEVIEMGTISMENAGAETELAQYKPFFTEACEKGTYDLIICMGAECNAALEDAAASYPDQLFFSCDLQDPLSQVYPNVSGYTYSNKDIGYLAGYVACAVTTSSMEKANADKKVGVIVGVDFPGLNEYIGSFCQVCAANGVTVYIDYAGDFTADIAPQVAEKALAMYNAGVDVVWQVAGSAGSGVFTAAKEAGRYSFGVDCDQTETVTDPEEAATIVTSFYADYATAIGQTVADVLNGEFKGGEYPEVGLSEGLIGYANNEQFASMVTPEIISGIDALYTEMASGNVEVFSVVADPEGWEALKAQVAPAD